MDHLMAMTNKPDAVETATPASRATESPQRPTEAPAAPRSERAPHDAPEAATRAAGAQDEAATAHGRPWTPDRRNDNGSTTITVKRCCNGCGTKLGDVTDREVNRAVAGLPLEDVRRECAHCRPLVELEAAGCKTWQITERSVSRVDWELDRLDVYAKGYWRDDDGKLKVVGLRVGTGETRVVAYFGDWLVMHPDSTFTVHKAPAAVTA